MQKIYFSKNHKRVFFFLSFLFLYTFSVKASSSAKDSVTLNDNKEFFDDKHEDKIDNSDSITVVKENSTDEINYRLGPVEEFFIDWDTSVVDPYQFNVKEITYDFPVCLFISNDDGYTLPLKRELYKTSPFGHRWGRIHKGVDLRVDVGDSVFNMFDGMVRISTYSSTYGHFIVVRHYNGLETLYAHLSARNVSAGDILKSGESVGLAGNTGRSTGPHLHFEIRYKGVAFDPENLLSIQDQDIIGEELTIEPKLFNYARYRGSQTTYSGKATYHLIQQGETLSSISRKYRTSVSALCRLNGISQTTIIRAGSRLRVR